jgi:hypothetical protein
VLPVARLRLLEERSSAEEKEIINRFRLTWRNIHPHHYSRSREASLPDEMRQRNHGVLARIMLTPKQIAEYKVVPYSSCIPFIDRLV